MKTNHLDFRIGYVPGMIGGKGNHWTAKHTINNVYLKTEHSTYESAAEWLKKKDGAIPVAMLLVWGER